MRRIGIFQLYSPFGLIEEYIDNLLDSMKSIVEKLMIVCNSSIADIELQKLLRHTDTILKRKNEGYDAGAYKDILLKQDKTFWDDWDEIVFFNCTFYGPFFPWTIIFEQMNKKNVDFWGLSRNPGNRRMRKDGKIAPEHLQSYFVVVRKNMFSSSCFWQFWIELKYPQNYYEAVEDFEWHFTSYFKEKGFKYTSWLDVQGYNPMLFKEVDPSFYPYELLRDYKFPVIKCKSMSIVNFEQMEKAINYLKNNTDYDIGLVTDHIKHLNSKNMWKPFSIQTLEKFVNTHAKMYIFGNGRYGKGIERYFQFREWKYVAHVVSHPRHNNEVSLEDLKLCKKDGLIVALGNVALKEVEEKLTEKFNQDQILFPDLN